MMSHLRRKLALFLAALIIAAASPPPVSAGVVVRIKDQATVSGSLIRLRDVASVTGAGAEDGEKLRRIVLGTTPPGNRTVRLDYSAIRSRLQSSGVDLSRIEFTGRNAVRVKRSVERPKIRRAAFTRPRTIGVSSVVEDRAEKLVTDTIRQYLRRHAPELGQVNLTVEIPPEDAADIVRALNRAFEVRGGSKPWLGRPHAMTLRFQDPRREIRTVEVRCFITRRPYVLTAKYRIPRGEIIQAAAVEWRQVESVDRGFTNLDDVVGQEASRTIAKDAVLRKTDVRRVPLVRVNNIVTVYSRRNGITVARQMKARKSGARGEMIPLVEINGRDVVTARVTALNQAEIVTTERSRLRSFGNDGNNRGAVVFRQPARTRPRTRKRITAPTRSVRRRISTSTIPRRLPAANSPEDIPDRFRPVGRPTTESRQQE